MNSSPNALSVTNVAAWLAVGIGVGLVLVWGRQLLVPLVIAILLWQLINAIAASYTRTAQFLTPFDFSLPLPLGLLFATASVIVVLALAGQLVTDNLQRLSGDTEGLRNALRQGLPMLAERLGLDLPRTIDGLYEQIPFGTLIGQTVASLTATAGSAGLILIYVLFLMLEQQSFDVKLRRLFPDPVHAARVRNLVGEIERRIEAYIRIKTLMSLLTGALSYVVLVGFGVDLAGFWALLIFLLNYIPNIGSILGVVFPTLMALVQFDDLGATVLLALLLTSLQFVIGNLVEPRLMGQQLNLSPFVIILSLAFWGSIWGIAGLFLAVPMTMIFAIVCARVPNLRSIAIFLSIDGRID